MTELATFAGGCFWCITKPFLELPGVKSVVAGYAGCESPRPVFDATMRKAKGCVEAVNVEFDPQSVSYAQLADLFFTLIDPTDPGGQFADRGPQYRTAIFYHGERQRSHAELARLRIAGSGRFSKPIVTAVRPFGSFIQAEDFHQNYYSRCPVNYRTYYEGSGRADFLRRTWDAAPAGKRVQIIPPEEELREKLSRESYRVAVLGGTEQPSAENGAVPAGRGLYVDVLSGAPMFSTDEQFDAGCGWPSFSAPMGDDCVKTLPDNSLGMARTETRCAHSNAHMGHVFNDGPAPTGKRFCINRAALRFIPAEELELHGYPPL